MLPGLKVNSRVITLQWERSCGIYFQRQPALKWVTDLSCWGRASLYSSGTALGVLGTFLVLNSCCAAARGGCLPTLPTFAAIQGEDLPHRNVPQPMGVWLEGAAWHHSLLECHVGLLTGKQGYFATAELLGMWYSSALLSLPFPASLQGGMFLCWEGDWSCNSALMCRAGAQE